MLCPGANFTTHGPRPPIEAMREVKLSIAIASDLNPGTSNSESLPLAMSLACVHWGMTPAEVLAGATVHAAHSLKLDGLAGCLRPGSFADCIVVDAGRCAEGGPGDSEPNEVREEKGAAKGSAVPLVSFRDGWRGGSTRARRTCPSGDLAVRFDFVHSHYPADEASNNATNKVRPEIEGLLPPLSSSQRRQKYDDYQGDHERHDEGG